MLFSRFQSITLLTQLSNFLLAIAFIVPGIVKLLQQVSLNSPAYIYQASRSCLLLFMHRMPWALALALAKAGNNRPARMAMMAITTNSSIKVKPLDWEGRVKFFIVLCTVIW